MKKIILAILILTINPTVYADTLIQLNDRADVDSTDSANPTPAQAPTVSCRAKLELQAVGQKNGGSVGLIAGLGGAVLGPIGLGFTFVGIGGYLWVRHDHSIALISMLDNVEKVANGEVDQNIPFNNSKLEKIYKKAFKNDKKFGLELNRKDFAAGIHNSDLNGTLCMTNNHLLNHIKQKTSNLSSSAKVLH